MATTTEKLTKEISEKMDVFSIDIEKKLHGAPPPYTAHSSSPSTLRISVHGYFRMIIHGAAFVDVILIPGTADYTLALFTLGAWWIISMLTENMVEKANCQTYIIYITSFFSTPLTLTLLNLSRHMILPTLGIKEEPSTSIIFGTILLSIHMVVWFAMFTVTDYEKLKRMDEKARNRRLLLIFHLFCSAIPLAMATFI
ncbi:hypothetical protein P280DRAFT_517055 [Massarina eburnea CBS 473.64]|uniref:Uncharacterized protein n=1 Tax=Massarina eburnea CBS 473.64 TaxID=1395130 RepID=A0A6A6S2L4_9PLEO|nr:hypothetical protein P280DRAFT_517055 [Massarina eburnea CBS 473.64]